MSLKFVTSQHCQQSNHAVCWAQMSRNISLQHNAPSWTPTNCLAQPDDRTIASMTVSCQTLEAHASVGLNCIFKIDVIKGSVSFRHFPNRHPIVYSCKHIPKSSRCFAVAYRHCQESYSPLSHCTLYTLCQFILRLIASLGRLFHHCIASLLLRNK